MLYPADVIVYVPLAASKLARPGTTAVPMSDWPSKMPIGVLKWVLARRKSGGGGTWVRVAVPGYAHSGACGLVPPAAGGVTGGCGEGLWATRVAAEIEAAT